jgi:hypothetical protein
VLGRLVVTLKLLAVDYGDLVANVEVPHRRNQVGGAPHDYVLVDVGDCVHEAALYVYVAGYLSAHQAGVAGVGEDHVAQQPPALGHADLGAGDGEFSVGRH